MGLDALPEEFWKQKEAIEKKYQNYQHNLVARDKVDGFAPRDRRPRDPFDILNKDLHKPLFCRSCGRTSSLRECWGCHQWFCYDCLIEHMIGCEEWQKIKGDYEILFECDKHETCDDCPFRFKCYTSKKIPKRKKK